MTTLVLDNFLDEKFSGYFSRYLRDDLEIFKASKLEFPENLSKYDHIILTGSEEFIINDRNWIAEEMKLIQKIIDKRIPTLGICFGHQLIARALLGHDGVRKAEKPEIGWKQVTINIKNPLLRGIGSDFFVYNSHFDEVCNLNKEFEILASSDLCEVQAYQIKNAPMWGVQFHPEIDMESGKKFIMDLSNMFPHLKEELGRSVTEAREPEISERLFENFYEF
jgi:GMP synthase-like glutamine amidotransferase